MDEFWQAVAAVVPSLGVLALFWVALRAIIGADRRERAAAARLDAQESQSEGPPGARP
jgi:hypothetical protein